MSTRDLETVLSDFRGDAAVLRRAGHEREAALREQLADEVTDAAYDYLCWLTESEAMIRSGRSRDWLRAQFRQWVREGHARERVRGERQYRALMVPRRAQVAQAAAAGREAARKAKERAA